MKVTWCFVIPVLAGLGLVGCGSSSGPIGGSFDPLSSPGNDSALPVVDVRGGIVPGKIAAISTESAAFFNKRPKGDADPDKLLRLGTQVKVVSVDGSYLKVELDDGAVGYVPAMMVEDPSARPSPNEIQVYPPPSGPGSVPIVPLAPGGAGMPIAPDMPEVIDPDAGPDIAPDAGAADQPPAPPPVPADLGTPAPPIRKDGEGEGE